MYIDSGERMLLVILSYATVDSMIGNGQGQCSNETLFWYCFRSFQSIPKSWGGRQPSIIRGQSMEEPYRQTFGSKLETNQCESCCS